MERIRLIFTLFVVFVTCFGVSQSQDDTPTQSESSTPAKSGAILAGQFNIQNDTVTSSESLINGDASDDYDYSVGSEDTGVVSLLVSVGSEEKKAKKSKTKSKGKTTPSTTSFQLPVLPPFNIQTTGEFIIILCNID